MMSKIAAVIITIIIYFLVLIVIGIISRRRSENTVSDFFVASRSFGTFIFCASLLATTLSTFTFMAGPALVYDTGLGFAGAYLVGSAVYSVFIVFLGTKIWKYGKIYGFITPSDLFKDRFESKTIRYIIFFASFIFVIPYLALQPIGGGYLISTLTGGHISYIWGAALITIFTIIYVSFSGQRAVAWNDAFQGILLFVVLLIISGMLVYVTGQKGENLSTMPEILQRGAGSNWEWPLIFSWLILTPANLIMQPHIFTRFYTSKNTVSIRRFFVFWPILSILIAVPIAFIGGYGKILYPALENSDQIVPASLMEFGSPFFVGIGAAGLLAALMSTSSGQILSLSSMFTRDLYGSIKKNVTEKEGLFVGRIMVVLLAVGGFLIGVNPPDLMASLASAAFSGIAVLTPSLIAAFYWKGTTATGVTVSIILGEAVIIYSYLLPFGQESWWGFMPVIPSLVVTCIALVVVSLISKAPSKETLNRYF